MYWAISTSYSDKKLFTFYAVRKFIYIYIYLLGAPNIANLLCLAACVK